MSKKAAPPEPPFLRVGVECPRCLKPCYAIVHAAFPMTAVPMCECGYTLHVLIESASPPRVA